MSSLNAVDRCSQIQNLARTLGFSEARAVYEDNKVRLVIGGMTGSNQILIPKDISIEQLRVDLKKLKDHVDQSIGKASSLRVDQLVKIVAIQASSNTDSTSTTLKKIEDALKRNKQQEDELSLSAMRYVRSREQQHAQSDGVDMTRKNTEKAVQEYQKNLDLMQVKADQERDQAIKDQGLKRDQRREEIAALRVRLEENRQQFAKNQQDREEASKKRVSTQKVVINNDDRPKGCSKGTYARIIVVVVLTVAIAYFLKRK